MLPISANSPVLHFEVLGRSDAQAIVYLHGLAGSTAAWSAPFRQLAASYRTVLVDLLGFGRSPKPDMDYSLDEHLLALHETLRRQGVASAHIVGHSMGALLALAYAARYPQAVSGLALLALPWYADAQDARRKIAKQSLFNRWLALDTPLAHFACMAMCRIRPWLMPWMPRLLRDVPPEVAKDVLRHNWLSYSRSFRHLILEAQPAVWLAQVLTPVLFIQGAQDETAPPAEVARHIANYANARLETIDAGHLMVFTHAAELAHLIDVFFREQQASRIAH